MSRSGAYYCDICEDGPFHMPHMVIGLDVIEDAGCMGVCDPEQADKHVCIGCAQYISEAYRPSKKAKKAKR